jgi:hypothetical protein
VAGKANADMNSKETEELGTKAPCQPKLGIGKFSRYPQTDGRRFRQDWYKERPWLEYCQIKDAAFCFPCRIFQPVSGDECFMLIGYRNWQHATDSEKGFAKHENSTSHKEAMFRWKERNDRERTGELITTKLITEQVERNRYYVRCIVEIIQFLVVNELPLRGDKEHDGVPSGLFQHLFQYTLTKDDKLRGLVSLIPKNATYMSPDIQNEVISALADVAIEIIVSSAQSSFSYAVMADETKDKQGIVNLAVALRYLPQHDDVKQTPTERCIAIVSLHEQNAQAITTAIKNVLRDLSVNTDKIIAQTYDGASVMSGNNAGVNVLLSNELGRSIPYIHCINHQLHLAIIGTLAANKDVRSYLDLCEELYKFFRRGEVARDYEGTTLKRLMEHRWSGHLATIDVIAENKVFMEETLTNLSDNGSAEVATLARGFLQQIKKAQFSFLTKLLNKLLHMMEPVNKQLQTHGFDIHAALSLVEAVREEVNQLRDDNKFSELAADSIALAREEDEIEENRRPSARRRRVAPTRLQEFVAVDRGYEYESNAHASTAEHRFKTIYYAVIDTCLVQFTDRFTEKNMSIVAAANNLLKENRSIQEIRPLISLLIAPTSTINSTTLEQMLVAEIPLANRLVGSVDSLSKLYEMLLPYRKALEGFYIVCCAALSLPCSTARVEACFSALTRVLKPQRVSMTHDRKAELVLLAFNKDIVRHINLDDFVIRFSTNKHRKLLLL